MTRNRYRTACLQSVLCTYRIVRSGFWRAINMTGTKCDTAMIKLKLMLHNRCDWIDAFNRKCQGDNNLFTSFHQPIGHKSRIGVDKSDHNVLKFDTERSEWECKNTLTRWNNDSQEQQDLSALLKRNYQTDFLDRPKKGEEHNNSGQEQEDLSQLCFNSLNVSPIIS